MTKQTKRLNKLLRIKHADKQVAKRLREDNPLNKLSIKDRLEITQGIKLP